MKTFNVNLPHHLHAHAKSSLHPLAIKHATVQPNGSVKLTSLRDDGVEFELAPIGETDEVKVIVIANPQGVDPAHIEKEFTEDFAKFLAVIIDGSGESAPVE